MKTKNRSVVWLVISIILFIISIPLAASALLHAQNMYNGVSPFSTFEVLRVLMASMQIFFWWAVMKQSMKGDYSIEAKTIKIFECQKIGSQNIKYVQADTVDEVGLYLDLTEDEQKYIITESDIKLEGFHASIPASSETHTVI